MKSASMKPIKVKSQTNTKKAKFNLSHDVNTTYDWGEVQPLLSKFMLPDSSINVNMEQLTRLAPMVVPTFGRVKMKNIAHFIPIKEIFPNWEYFLAKNPVTRPTAGGSTSFVPSEVPHINSSILTAMALAGAKFNWYMGTPDSSGNVNMWYHWHNEGSWATPLPTGNANAINAGRALLAQLLLLTNSQAPVNVNCAFADYIGPTMSITKITKGSAAQGVALSQTIQDSQGRYIGTVPTITTMYPNTLDTNIYGMNGYTHSANDERIAPNGSTFEDKHITLEEADLIWESDVITAAKRSDTTSIWNGMNTTFFDGNKVRLVFKLSSFGKRLRKILIACGYNFSLNDDTEVSLLPLMAFYKAYWDSYAPERVKNFYVTACWELSQFCCDANTNCRLTTILNNTNTDYNDIRSKFKQFIFSELGNCFATEPINTISAATNQPLEMMTNGTQTAIGEINNVLKEWYETVATANFANGSDADIENISGLGMTTPYPKIDVNNSGSLYTLTQPVLDALKKAYIYTNKYSVAGHQIEEILRMNGLGKYVEECKGKFIAGSEDAIKISDVVSTADTTAMPSYTGIKGAALGQYGGRGMGMGTDQFSYSTDVHGYLMLISSIIPESGYTNCVDLTNECITAASLYNPEFDGLNYEAVQKKQIIGSTVINNREDTSHNDTFGFLPTYSKWKMCNNIANGDFSLASMRTSLIPYTLDKYIPVNEVNVTNTYTNTAGGGSAEIKVVTNPFTYSDLPNAGEDYRYINKMPWNGNYNRIFATIGDGLEWETIVSNNNGAYLYNSFEYDNFLTHNVFNIGYWAPMKSIEDSYSTYDDEDTAPTGGISKA